MSPQKWIKETNTTGIISKSGRYDGGTFAHPDIAFEFASWLSPEFKLYLIKKIIKLGLKQSDRLVKLNDSDRKQMGILKNNNGIKELEVLQKQINNKDNKSLIQNK